MTSITLVAAVAENGVIGKDGGLPWHLPDDLRHFKSLTLGHTLVMGRRTFESIGRALPGRRSIVITRSGTWRHSDVEVAHSVPEALSLAGPGDEVFVVGGAQVYAAALPFARRLVLTEVVGSPVGDTVFPPWSREEWKPVARVEHETFAIVTYTRR